MTFCDAIRLFYSFRLKFTAEPRLLLGIARIHDALNLNAIVYYKNVLALDASNVESIACLGAHFFYSDQVHQLGPGGVMINADI